MDIIQHYNNFIQGYNAEQKDIIWKQQSQSVFVEGGIITSEKVRELISV